MKRRISTFIAFLAFLQAGSASAQERSGTGVFLPTEGEYQILFQRIEKSRREENWDAVLEGLARYAELVRRPELNPVISSGGGISLGVRRTFSKLVGSLPPAELERYRERLDALLVQIWNESLERDDPAERRKLRHRVLRDYTPSRVYPLALAEEADEAFELGDWERAKRATESILDSLPGGAVGEETRVRARLLLTQIAAVNGDTASVKEHREALLELRSSGTLERIDSDLRARADAVLAASPESLTRGRGGAPLLRLRSGLENPLEPLVLPVPAGLGTADGYRLGSVVWQRRAVGSNLRPFMTERSRTATRGNVPLPYYAVARDDLILFQHADRLVAFDNRAGRELWSKALAADPGDFGEIRAPLVGSGACYYVHGHALHAIERSKGTPLWARSFVYEKGTKTLKIASGAEPPRPADEPEGPRAESPAEEAPAKEPAESEPGKEPEKEAQAGEDPKAEDEPRKEEDEPAPNDREFPLPEAKKAAKPRAGDRSAKEKAAASSIPPSHTLSPPVAFGDKVVVCVKVRLEQETLFYLAALESTGEEYWSTYIGSAQGGNYLGLGGAASIPLAHGGVVYQVTNMGFVAAVDGEDGTLLWIGEYPKLGARGRRQSIRSENRWQTNPALPVGSEILVAPQDSPYLLALRKGSGDISWMAPREHASTLVGADSVACFVAGTELTAIAHSGERRGSVVWRASTEDSQIADETGRSLDIRLGRPFFTPEAILLPSRSGLYRFSPADGRLLSRTLWDFAGGGGNLLLYRNVLAVTNPEGFLIYSDLAQERSRIQSLPADPPETQLEKAKFHLKNGELELGLGVLRSWASSAPPAPAPNSILDHLHLDLASMVYDLSRGKEGQASIRELLRLRVLLERTPERKVEAAIDLANLLEREGDRGEALAALHDALAYDNPVTEHSLAGGLRVPSAAWIRNRIEDLRRSDPRPEVTFARIDAAAREAHRAARKKGTAPSYLDVIRLYPYTPAVAEAYLDLSVCYRDRQSFDQAIKALEGYLRDYPNGKDAVRVKLLMANLLHQSGRRRQARDRYEEIRRDHPTSIVTGISGIQPGETVEQYVEPILKDRSFMESAIDEPPELKFPVRMAWRSPADLQAISRTFLTPKGEPPPGLRDTFLTQSSEVLELRNVETGLPLWRIQLEMIPGFEFDEFAALAPRLPYSKLSMQGRFVTAHAGPDEAGLQRTDQPLLVLHNDRNVFALDALRGSVRWHMPIGSETDAPGAPGGETLRSLKEKLRGVAVTDEGVFASTSKKRLIRIGLDGSLVWSLPLDYEPGPQAPAVHGESVFVFSSRPASIRIHDRGTGTPSPDHTVDFGADRVKQGLEPIELPGGRLLVPFENELQLFDLATGTFLWSYPSGDTRFLPGAARRPRGVRIEEVEYSPDHPAECIVFTNRANNWPAMASVSIATGEENWRYEKFPAQQAKFLLFRKGDRFYVVHGEDRLNILALEVRKGDDAKPVVDAVWPNEVPLGTFHSGISRRRLDIGGDAVFFGDGQRTISVYDRTTGASRTASASAISKFLVEKRNFASTILGGKLILLTDGGDCAFESVPPADADVAGETEIRLARAYLANPGSVENVSRLALEYFRTGEREAAMNLLNRALLSEDVLQEMVKEPVLPKTGPEKRYLLAYLLDGIKEEHMKEGVPRIACRQFRMPPAIDGELNDAWDVATRIHLATPRNVGTIPGREQLSDWEGEEDLSAYIYTGWDETYFYFAMDVMDDSLHPYDKDADNWKGDCLLIGLDPLGDGGHDQDSNDQLMTLALTVPKRNKLDKDKKKAEGEESEEEEDERKPDGLFSVKKKEDDSGAVYEVALPWESFSKEFEKGAPPRGYVFGLSLLLTDDDTGQGATKTLSMNPCHLLPRSQRNSWVWRFIIPMFFPKVTLE